MIALTLSTMLSASPQPAQELVQMLEGRWDNSAQLLAEGDTDRPHLFAHHMSADGQQPSLFANLYLGGPEGELYRERLYTFEPASDGATLRMLIWAPAQIETSAREDGFRAIYSGYERLDPGCDFYWSQVEGVWTGVMQDEACRITSSRSGIEMIINAEFTISDDHFTHSESGRNAETGEALFAPPNGVPNIYDRVED